MVCNGDDVGWDDDWGVGWCVCMFGEFGVFVRSEDDVDAGFGGDDDGECV